MLRRQADQQGAQSAVEPQRHIGVPGGRVREVGTIEHDLQEGRPDGQRQIALMTLQGKKKGVLSYFAEG